MSYNTQQVADLAGLSYRQVDHLVRKGYVAIDRPDWARSGTDRDWTATQAELVIMTGRLIKAGFGAKRAADLARSITAWRSGLSVAVDTPLGPGLILRVEAGS